MKKIIIGGGVALCMLTSVGLNAQTEMTALGISSGYNPSGSARYLGLSGALGAVGADFSSVHQNPAGIALFRSGSKVSLTGAYGARQGTGDWGADKLSVDKGGLRFEELSFLTSWELASGRTMTFGVGATNAGRFGRDLDVAGTFSPKGGISLADYSAALLNLQSRIPLPNVLTNSNPFASGAPWLGILGYNNGWINYNTAGGAYESGFVFDEGGASLIEGPRSASLITEESGAMTNYDFALGFQASPSFHVGLSMTLTSLSYRYNSWYQEGFRPTPWGETYGLSLDNQLEMDGTGVRFGFGIIGEPVDGLRLGASIYTPTFYSLTMDIPGRPSTGVSPTLRDKDGNLIKRAIQTTPPSESAVGFGLRTPWRLGLSAAYIFDRTAILSADYEYTDHGGSRLTDPLDDYDIDANHIDWTGDNKLIKSHFGGQHTLRLGFEVNASRRLALRAGARFASSIGYHAGLKRDIPTEEVAVPGVSVHYRLPGAMQSYSLGFGYRLSRELTLDVAYVFGMQKDRVYAFPSVTDTKQQQDLFVAPNAKIVDRQHRHQLAATLSYRF